jgi:very-short-patch-repair endonuclease
MVDRSDCHLVRFTHKRLFSDYDLFKCCLPPLPVIGERIEVRGTQLSFHNRLRVLNSPRMTRARYLRKKATDCERILWRHLRNRKFVAYKFRRQHPIDPYVLDFYCPALKLAIELDGSGHDSCRRGTHDKTREKFLALQGIAVVRFWNHQIREELDSVLEAIWLALEDRARSNPSPSSSPFEKGRGDRK